VSGLSSLSAAELGEADGNGNALRTPSTLETVKEGPRRQLKVLSIVGLCYFAVCGGPIGSEYIISGACTAERGGTSPCSAIDVRFVAVCCRFQLAAR
jgi:hypothetical protein